MINVVSFFIAAFASCVGAVSGIGGGVIIKPVFDSLGIFTVPTVSFLSGCTVLTMSAVSLARSGKSGVKIDPRVSLFLAVGAAGGGVCGKMIFNSLHTALNHDTMIGLIQSVLLCLINVFVFVFVLNKSRITMLKIQKPVLSLCIGLFLGVISVFLGIGGGPINVAVLYYFYSMSSKEAAVNSLFIILCSQITGLAQTLITASVPVFPVFTLIFMCLGGVTGAVAGSKISRRLGNRAVERLFTGVLIVLILLNINNIIRYIIKL